VLRPDGSPAPETSLEFAQLVARAKGDALEWVFDDGTAGAEGRFQYSLSARRELFDAMVIRHLDGRRKVRSSQFAEGAPSTLIHDVLEETVNYYWGRRRFWRAALIRSMREPAFWAPMRNLSHEFADSLIAHMAARAGRSLKADEEANVRFAVQVTFGTINNTILNRPGPFFMDQALFVQNLVRAFRLVSDYDKLVADSPAEPKRSKTARARRSRTPR
jgi:hypothetical protein